MSREMRVMIAAAVAGLTAMGGCGSGGSSEPLEPSAFHRRQDQQVVGESPTSVLDQPGALLRHARVNVDVLDRDEPDAPVPLPEEIRRSEAQPLPDSDEVIARAAENVGARLPVTRPSTLPTTTPVNGYYTVGAVVAEVNGRPIYADRVLAIIEPILSTRAMELTEEQFRAVATDEIARQVRELTNDELVFAAAEKSLSQQDRVLALRLTEQWRQQQITAAGGSEDQARLRARAAGTTFEEQVNERYRRFMTQLYNERRVRPRIQVTADDMRRYYFNNLDKEFTRHGEVSFHLVRVAVPRGDGGRDRALATIQKIREEITERAADIADAARRHDQVASMMGPIQRGAFVLEKVEEQLWKTDVGELTEIIDAGDAFYLARVEEKKAGKVEAFENPRVQRSIQDKLFAQQFDLLRQQMYENLIAQSVIRGTREMMGVALEMAMQKYPEWASAEK